ncbi:hypothetical protein AGMMS50255_6750 [Spirochaetia bacterium]|nr:hypothetical protein AGMMS50255_6750 [Spirochaetia bacterium]
MKRSVREKLYIDVVSSAVRGWSGRLSGSVSDVADVAHSTAMKALRNYDSIFVKPKSNPLMFLHRMFKPKS